jgi:hypothetical protein
VNSKEAALKFRDEKMVDGIITNFPDILKQWALSRNLCKNVVLALIILDFENFMSLLD